MRIALLSYSTKPRGGVVHTLALAEALARRGAEVTVWSLGRGGDGGFFRPVSPSVSVRIVPFPDLGPSETVGERILRSIAVLRSAFTPSGYDIVHAQDCISANAVDRCIRTAHHLDRFTTPELVACHSRAIVRPYAHICVSAAVAAEVRAGWGIAPTVIPNGVDFQRFSSPSAAADGARWRSRFGRYILAVGGIEPRKGSMDLLSAYSLVHARDPGVRLVIAGGETLFDYRDYRGRWEARARSLFGSGAGAPVVLGVVAHDEVPSLMAAASAFCFPSVKEGFGLAAMEALAAGVPVVTRDLPVLREVFRDTVRYAATPSGLASALRAALSPGNVAGLGDSGGVTGSGDSGSVTDVVGAGGMAGAGDSGCVGDSGGWGGVGDAGVVAGSGGIRPSAGRALAASYTWDAAAAAHLAFYQSHPALRSWLPRCAPQRLLLLSASAAGLLR